MWGEKVTHLTPGPLLKRSIWGGLAAAAAEWRRFRLVLSGRGFCPAASTVQYRAEQRRSRPAQGSVDVAHWRTCDMFPWSYSSCWLPPPERERVGWTERTACSIRVSPFCIINWLDWSSTLCAWMWCDVMSGHLFLFPARFVALCEGLTGFSLEYWK